MRILVLSLLVACSIPNTQFAPSPDSTIGGDGEPGAGVQIVATSTNVSVNEGAAPTVAFSVHLSKMPDQAITVNVAPKDTGDGTAVIAVEESQLSFEPQTFGMDQDIHVTGLADADAIDEHEDVELTSEGLTSVDVVVTNHDTDRVAIATDITGSTIGVNENGSVDVMVHLTHEPQADVTITATAVSPSISLDNATMQFTHDTYDTPQTLTIHGLDDANAMAEQVALTLHASGTGIDDAQYTIDTVDDDALNIHASPLSLTVPEGSMRELDVSLTADPGGPITVTLDTSTGSASIIGSSSIMFDSNDWSMPVAVQIAGVEDQDTQDDTDMITLSAPSLTSVTVSVHITDNDTQHILTDAPNTVTLNEGASSPYHATLQFMPAADITIQLASAATGTATVSPGSLTFTPQNYADTSHTFTITGTHDTNLTPDATTITLQEASIGSTPIAVTVNDIDSQAYVVSNSNLTVNEGSTGTFTVKLAYDPGTTQSISIADTNTTSLPVSPSSFTFTGGAGGTWNTAKTITVSPPLDTNATAESATLTITGATGAPDHAVAAQVVDTTTLHQFGNPSPIYTSSELINAEVAVAIRVTTNLATTVDTLAVNVPAGTGDYTMAVYSDNGGMPGNLLASMSVGAALVTGTNVGNVTDTQLAAGTYWVAIRFDQDIPVSQSTVGMQNICVKNIPYNGITDVWLPMFGASTCESDYLFNIWMNTYNQ